MRKRPDIARSADLLVAVAGHARAGVRFAVADLTQDEYDGPNWWPPDVER